MHAIHAATHLLIHAAIMEDDRQPQDAQLPELASTADLGAELRDKFLAFLESFTEADAANASNAPEPEGGEAELFYVNQVHAMRTDEKSTLFVDFCHVDLHDWELARTIETEFLRVETYLRKVIAHSSLTVHAVPRWSPPAPSVT
jgi:MCM N-terminal domain